MPTAKDTYVIAQVLQGDAEAFGTIVKKYEKPVFNLMLRATGSQDEAADLTQEAFLKAYDKIATYRAGKSFFAWLYTIGLNVVRDHLRRQKRNPLLARDGLESARSLNLSATGAGETERRLAIQSLFQALKKLPLDYREVLLLRYREGRPSKEIAKILGITVSGAKMRIHRGLEKLRAIMQETPDEKR